jgi:wyosine [tRNA(Phe)-imidazoG37] synthetase (radical SAM superfamily)
MIVFGPIPSRRLGRSLGINNIPPKTCSYSCVYCQVGRTSSLTIKRKSFFNPEDIYKETAVKIKLLEDKGEKIDYITFVPDGEPTLDINLGASIKLLREFGIKIAVITNGSMLWDDTVKKDLIIADLISIKIDSVFRGIWKKINRPHGELKLNNITRGILEFSGSYQGTLYTESMLVEELNDTVESLYLTADFIKNLQPAKAYLLVPTRPPAEENTKAPHMNIRNTALQIFRSKIENSFIIDYDEGNHFSFTSEAKKELLDILSVHPMRKKTVEDYLNEADLSWDIIKTLIGEDIIRAEEYSGETFYVKNN